MKRPVFRQHAAQFDCGYVFLTLICATPLLGCGDDSEPPTTTATAPVATSSANIDKSDPSLVRTTGGLVRGNVDSEYRQFLGIPYAAPPVDSRRWKAPQPAPSWRGVRDASLPKDKCPQFGYTGPGVGSAVGNEDCLFVNVTTPNKPSKKKLPVMVGIHGGGYTGGSGTDDDVRGLVQRADVIVVTLNYRLGAFGFLSHPALTAESREASGNYGFLDQQAALVWVKENIAEFGGDPNNVTIYGVSAGGNSVWAHLISPRSAGLFQRAISVSGLWSTSWNWMGYDEPAQPFELADAEAIGSRFAQALGCTGSGRSAASCLRNSTAADLVELGGTDLGPVYFVWGPTTGGAVLPRTLRAALSTGAFNRVPIINGSTHDEAMPYVMMPFWIYTNNPLTPEVYAQTLSTRFGDDASTVLARYPVETYGAAACAYSAVDTDVQNACYTRAITRLAAAYTKVYAYEFNDPQAPYGDFWSTVFGGPPPYALRAYHASDVQYFLPSRDGNGAFTPEQVRLSDQMIEYYTSFARSGTPQGATPWLPYDPRVDSIQSLAPSAIAPITSFASDHQCDFWAQVRGI